VTSAKPTWESIRHNSQCLLKPARYILDSLRQSGDAALVQRGMPRMLLIKCPCGCGDTLVINLDQRLGHAWRMYSRDQSLTLFPSYWRDDGCKSHFILWKNRIYWCDWDDDSIWVNSNDIEKRVLEALPHQYINYEKLAEQLQEIPWDVLQACHALTRKALAEMNHSRRKGEFRRIAKPASKAGQLLED